MYLLVAITAEGNFDVMIKLKGHWVSFIHKDIFSFDTVAIIFTFFAIM